MTVIIYATLTECKLKKSFFWALNVMWLYLWLFCLIVAYVVFQSNNVSYNVDMMHNIFPIRCHTDGITESMYCTSVFWWFFCLISSIICISFGDLYVLFGTYEAKAFWVHCIINPQIQFKNSRLTAHTKVNCVAMSKENIVYNCRWGWLVLIFPAVEWAQVEAAAEVWCAGTWWRRTPEV